MVITSYFLSRHLHRPCVIHDLSTIHVPQLCLSMVIVVVNHMLKHITKRNHIVITSTGTLNNNTPLSTSITNKFLSAWSWSTNTGISPLPSPPSSISNTIWSLWCENYTQLKLKKQNQKPAKQTNKNTRHQYSLGKNTLNFVRELHSLSFKLRKHCNKIYTNIIL